MKHEEREIERSCIAYARLHRTGQTNPVQVYYLIAKDTVDEGVLLALRKKRTKQTSGWRPRQNEN